MESIQKCSKPKKENVYLKTIAWVLRKTLLASMFVIKVGAKLSYSIIKNQLTARKNVKTRDLPTDPHTAGSY